jgi:mitochondrial fission protein ELM1
MIGGAEPVWVLADPRAGTAAQAIGIAERLGLPFRTVPLAWGALARLPLGWPTLIGLSAASRAAFRPPWPRLVVSAGRRSAPVALWLGRRGARVVHCMRAPGSGGFDLQVVGAHDRVPPAPNRLEILGAAHRISPTRLAEAREHFAGLADLPSPRVALLLGGPVRGEGLDPGIAAALGRQVAGFAGSVMATASRRTGPAATQALAESLKPIPHRLHAWGSADENPLLGFMAWADVMVVSGDSVSMLSEALVTPAPLFIAPLGDEGPRHRALHDSLYAAGQARPIADAPTAFAREPRDEVARIVAAIRARGLLTDG